MAIQAVAGAVLCGSKRPAQEFTSTGNAKGHFSQDICDKPKHSGNQHRDSVTGKTWRA